MMIRYQAVNTVLTADCSVVLIWNKIRFRHINKTRIYLGNDLKLVS